MTPRIFLSTWLAAALLSGSINLVWASDNKPATDSNTYTAMNALVLPVTPASVASPAISTPQSQVVSLLLQSFNGHTHVDELNSALQKASQSAPKSDTKAAVVNPHHKKLTYTF